MAYKLTKEKIKQEIRKCGKDPVYFIKNYCKISHPEKGLILFKTFDYQEQLIEDFKNHRFNIILKARQLGISTIVAGYVAWLLLFRREKTVGVIATKFDVAANIVKKVKAMINHLPDWIKIAKIRINNQTSFELTNGSWIKALPSSSDAGRSEALSLLIFDEAAFIEGLDELWRGSLPTISAGGHCVALSTPMGASGWFYDTYTKAVSGENNFHPTLLHWSVHPDRDQEWFDEMTKNMSKRDIAQEYECSFNLSGEGVIHPEDIERIRNTVSEPRYRTGVDRNFWIWDEYDEDFSYMVCADISRGDGADYTAAHVFRLEDMKQVAEYRGKPRVDMCANILNSIGREYGDALMVVENNVYGSDVLLRLKEADYPNIYHSIKGTGKYIDKVLAENNEKAISGFTTSHTSRPMVINKLEEYIRNRRVKINSERVVNELNTFVWKNGKPQAQNGANDDLVMAMAIACWVRDVAIDVAERDVQFNQACLDNIIVADSRLNTNIPGQIGYNSVYSSFGGSRQVADAKRQIAAYKWLYLG